MPIKLIIDTDPGIDDAMAIFCAIADPDIDLIGMTSVFGNVTVEQGTRNALRLAEWAGVDIPVAQGLEAPRELPPFPTTSWVHGDEGFGTIPAETPNGRALDETAPEYLVRMARKHKGELVLCPIGPLTNIAAAIDLDPDFTRNLESMVIMGGSLRAGGNVTKFAEANIYHDPHAANVVFRAGGNITLVGLDVTNEILCRRAFFAELAGRSPKLGGLLHKMTEFYIDFYESVGKFDGCALHDPAAVIACIAPDLFTTEAHPLRVICEGERSGETLIDTIAPAGTINVCTTVDVDAVKAKFFNEVAKLP